MGAEIVTYGTTSDARQQKVDQLSHEHGYAQVHPFADPVLIDGQGTIGLEILADLPDADDVYVPIGGGGLISGIAVAIKEQRPATRVYGVEPENSNAMWEALRHKGSFALSSVDTIADGLAARNYRAAQLRSGGPLRRRCVLVSDRDIAAAMLFLLEYRKVVVEPSGATSFAGLLANPRWRGKAVALMSGNVTLSQLEDLRRTQGV
jgi:threonine dehydratase